MLDLYVPRVDFGLADTLGPISYKLSSTFPQIICCLYVKSPRSGIERQPATMTIYGCST